LCIFLFLVAFFIVFCLTVLLGDLHGDSFHFGVGLETILAQFTTIARHLEATEGSLGAKHVIAVDPVIISKN
jgi:hypothetical protein